MSKCDQSAGATASAAPPFIARGWRGNRHFQTIWPNRIKRDPAGARLAARSTAEIITSEDGDRLRLYWSRHAAAGDGGSGAAGDPAPAPGATGSGRPYAPPDDSGDGVPPGGSRDGAPARPRPVLVVLHGLTGCADADNVMATAAKGHATGFDVVRADLRNTQADDAPSLGIGHAGRSEDARAILDHVADVAPGAATALIGFSLGGNITLKALGEYGAGPPAHLRAAATISVPIDLNDACTAIDERRENWIYRTYFLRRLARRYLPARAARPDLFHPIDVDRIRGIRDWDNAVVAPLGGFLDADDYYARNSSLGVIGDIHVPTALVQAQDDPFIPFAPYESSAVRDNPNIELLAPPQGGHVGFFCTEQLAGEPDRYWAENRAVAYCAAAVGLSWKDSMAGQRATGDNGAGADPAAMRREPEAAAGGDDISRGVGGQATGRR